MNFTKDEKQFLTEIVKRELDNFHKEEKTIIDEISPAFLAVEKKYDEFLKELLNKLN